jgi:hypothetical protein
MVAQSELPVFNPVSFEDAVRLFQSWGFQVEPGPQPEQVTLILEAPDHRTYCVHPANMLSEMAAVAMRVRFLNGAMYEASRKLWQAGQGKPSKTIAPASIEVAPAELH